MLAASTFFLTFFSNIWGSIPHQASQLRQLRNNSCRSVVKGPAANPQLCAAAGQSTQGLYMPWLNHMVQGEGCQGWASLDQTAEALAVQAVTRVEPWDDLELKTCRQQRKAKALQ